MEPEHRKANAFCRKLMGNRDDGDDLYQDSLVSALSGFEKLRQTDAFRSWLYRIIMNTYKNRFRRPWWQVFTPLTAEHEASLGGDNPAPMLAARRRLAVAFKALSAADRALVTLFELQGWSIAELAALTGKSSGNVKVRLLRARRKMRRALVRHLEQPREKNLAKTLRSEETICAATKPSEE